MLATGVHILRSRCRLVAGPVLDGQISQSWIGIDEDDNKFLVKVWPFEGERPDDLQRALWDAELRTLYRVGSSPGAENCILVIRDAGVDRDSRCFAMVLQAPGYEPLSGALGQRAATPWLQSREPQSRFALWTGLANLAEGVALLHEQHIIHRDISAETVYYASGFGPSSFRLGGFEWSVRLGARVGGAVAHVPGMHAKVVVSDSSVCISSYNFLSADPFGTAKRARELGVVIESEAVARTVAEQLIHLVSG